MAPANESLIGWPRYHLGDAHAEPAAAAEEAKIGALIERTVSRPTATASQPHPV
jgi:hypothetical protein